MELTDTYGLDSDTPERQRALAAALRNDRDAGALTLLSGAKSLQPFGKMMETSADTREKALIASQDRGFQRALTQQHYAQQAAERAAQLKMHTDRMGLDERYRRDALAARGQQRADAEALKRELAAADVPDLSQEALDQAAEVYATNQQLPSMGLGKQGGVMKRRIMDRAAELFPGGDMAGQAAAYKADRQSLQQLQVKMDNLSAYEKMAGKNLDVMEEAQKGVYDSGIPIANHFIRTLQRAGGNANVAKFDIARQTAAIEAARILNNPNLTGELSDSARKELNDIVRGDATTEQALAVLGVIRRDFRNRFDATTAQLGEIRGRIDSRKSRRPQPGAPAAASAAGAPAAGAPAAAPATPKRIKVDANGDPIQ